MLENAVAHRDLDLGEASWYAIYTIVRHEKSVRTAQILRPFFQSKKCLAAER